MSKDLYKEALADVKKVREIAVKDAQHEILESLTPRIREFIENQLLGREDDLDGDVDDDADMLDVAEPVSTPQVAAEVVPVQPTVSTKPSASTSTIDILPPAVANPTTIPVSQPPVIPTVPAAPGAAMTTAPVAEPVAQLPLPEPVAIEVPPSETPVVVDDDACDDSTCDVDVVDNGEEVVDDEPVDFDVEIERMGESIKKIRKTAAPIRETKYFKKQISRMITGVENMYDYVQESIVGSTQKSRLEERLEGYYKQLNNLNEGIMKKNRLNEGDVTLKLTGLPDDLELEDLGVDLITGEEDEEGLEGDVDGAEGEDLDLDLDGSAEGEEAPATDDTLDLDMEGADLDDDTVVEIDEAMLRREIKRLAEANLAPNKLPKNATKGKAMSPKVLDDFGNGDGEGDVLDESDDSYMEEEEEFAAETSTTQSDTSSLRTEEEENLACEAKVQRDAIARGATIKKRIGEARKSGNAKLVERLRAAYVVESKRYTLSVKKTQNLKKLVEASQKVSSNSKPDADNLRQKLSEANLDNEKLRFANKVLQMSSISNEKKLRIIEQLDTARTPREVKILFESAARLTESNSSEKQRTLVSGASRPMTSGGVSKTVNENVEVDHWLRLAGIKQ